MINKGLFSKLYIDDLSLKQKLDDNAEGRMATLSQAWQNKNADSLTDIWDSFVKQALGFLEFAASPVIPKNGFVNLFDDFDFARIICVVCLVDPMDDINDTRLGRFWPGKLIDQLKKRQLHWGILTNGSMWRLYSIKSAKPYEDYVQLNLGSTLESHDNSEYALFENFFHAQSFIPERLEDEDCDN